MLRRLITIGPKKASALKRNRLVSKRKGVLLFQMQMASLRDTPKANCGDEPAEDKRDDEAAGDDERDDESAGDDEIEDRDSEEALEDPVGEGESDGAHDGPEDDGVPHDDHAPDDAPSEDEPQGTQESSLASVEPNDLEQGPCDCGEPDEGSSESGSPNGSPGPAMPPQDPQDEGCSDAADTVVLGDESDRDSVVYARTPPNVIRVARNPELTYNPEIFESPMFGNSGPPRDELVEMCISLMEYFCDNEPDIAKLLIFAYHIILRLICVPFAFG